MVYTEKALELFLSEEEGSDGTYSEMMSISAPMIDY
jgi:hypothetical protein